jgi:hypothetical protein
MMSMPPISVRYRVPLFATFMAAVGFNGHPVHAQTSLPRTIAPPTIALSDDVAHTFSHYAFPSACHASKNWSEQHFWRDKVRDTTYRPRAGVPLVRRTVDSARACVARFSVATVAPRDLLGLGQAYLTAEQPANADTAFAALMRVNATAPVRSRAWTLYQIIDSHLGAAVPALATVDTYVARLDALGADAAVERMLAHKVFADVARARDSVALWERELRAARTAMSALPSPSDLKRQVAHTVADVYVEISELMVRQGRSSADVVALLDTAYRELVPLRESATATIQGARYSALVIGKAAPRIHATRWFASEVTDTIRPALGKVNLIVFVPSWCGGSCYATHAIVRRLVAKFGTRGLVVTYVTRTGGNFKAELMPADAEMEKSKSYYLDTLKLPVGLAISKTSFGKRDDGRLFAQDVSNEAAYGPVSSHFLIDQAGRIRLGFKLTPANEAIYEDVIEALLQGPP